MKILIITSFSLLILFPVSAQNYINYADGKPIKTSWKYKKSYRITNGNLDTALRNNPRGKLRWIEIDLTAQFKIGGIHMHIDNKGILPLREFKFQYKKDTTWVYIPGTDYKDNFSSRVSITFQELVSTNAIRLVTKNETTFGICEIQVWGGEVPEIPYGLQKKEIKMFKTDTHWVCVNQVAYNLNAPKGFTVPTAKTNLPFSIIEKNTEETVYTGYLHNGKGDFTSFVPEDPDGKEYYIHVEGDSLEPSNSYPFIIGEQAIQKMAYKPMVEFFNDARSVMGTHRSAYGGTAWRDGTYYTYEVPSMVILYLSNPDVFDNMPVTLNWFTERDTVNSPGFRILKDYKDDHPEEEIIKYYNELPEPISADVPDIIQCMRFGIGWNLIDPVTLDPSGDILGNRLHSQTIEQFAYFLYGYPAYKQYIGEDFYQMVLDSTIIWWEKSGLFDVITTIGTPKGRHCPGHSIMPNLLMYEVGKREKLDNPEKYLTAAQNQTQWIIDHADWNNPAFTKGQRISEHKLVTGLTHFLLNYPEQAPEGLKQKLVEWAEVVVSLSGNMWDFRRFDLHENWTLPGYNEAGNVIAFPACALSVALILEEGELKDRIVELAYSHYDNFCGRNPQNAHCANHPEKGFEGIERGWPYGDRRRDICARLELVRGSLSSLPGSEMYPFNPNGRPRHGEGWTSYNANWNLTIAYLNFFEGISSAKILKDLE